MNIQMACPWCLDDVDFVLDEADEELVCSHCSTRLAFAPDPIVTFGLLYEAAA
jgi:DNA-directed RNA polymerase subunit RPC12/RpoP